MARPVKILVPISRRRGERRDPTLHAAGDGPNLGGGKPLSGMAESRTCGHGNSGRSGRGARGLGRRYSQQGQLQTGAHSRDRGRSEARRDRFHYGLTSNDVVDTAQSLLVKEASDVIRKDLQRLSDVLKRRAWEFKDTPMIGRTHGIHAEPITFGLKLANWYSEVQRDIARFEDAAEGMRVGKFSGAVGTFAHLSPELEEKMCARLGLKAAAISSQVIQRDRHAHYLATLAVIACTLDKICTEIRHLQRTEVREAEEYFSEKQKGSSAMPHKRNPVTCEQICGLARVVRSNAQAGFEDVALWHERDISHSSVERVILPDSTTLVNYMLE